MKIQEDLAWYKHTGELIGFADIGDIETNYATLKDVQELASHVLGFLVKKVLSIHSPTVSQDLLLHRLHHFKFLLYFGKQLEF